MRMPRMQITIGRLMAGMALGSLGLACLIYASSPWAKCTLSLALGILTLAILGAILRRGERRAYWIGFALCGWTYLILVDGPWFRTYISPRLVMTDLLTWAYPLLVPESRRPEGYAASRQTVSVPRPTLGKGITMATLSSTTRRVDVWAEKGGGARSMLAEDARIVGLSNSGNTVTSVGVEVAGSEFDRLMEALAAQATFSRSGTLSLPCSSAGSGASPGASSSPRANSRRGATQDQIHQIASRPGPDRTTTMIITTLRRVGFLVAMMAVAPAAASTAEDPEPRTGPMLLLDVIDQADRSPLPGATVWVRARGVRVRTWEGATDDRGRYEIVPPDETTQSFDVSIALPGYVLGGFRAAVGATETTVKLDRAEPIGGIVRDEEGRPIAGALVFATAYPFALAWPEIAESPNGGLAIATTDAQGRWRADALPVGTGPEKPVRVRVTHPDHIAAECRITAGEARGLAGVQVMRTGLAISGTVLSPFGRPVRGAAVTVAMPPWDGALLRLTTDRDGGFRSGRCLDPQWSLVELAVQAPGLAWAVCEVPFKPQLTPQVVRLTPRRPLAGRVVDARGRSMAGAVVASSRSFFKGLLAWDAQADADGRFLCREAPTDGVILIEAFKGSFRSINKSILRPGADEVTITMHPG